MPKKFLLWAVLSCRSFVGPALDLMWKTMHSLTPFYALFSSLKRPSGMSVCVGLIVNCPQYFCIDCCVDAPWSYLQCRLDSI